MEATVRGINCKADRGCRKRAKVEEVEGFAKVEKEERVAQLESRVMLSNAENHKHLSCGNAARDQPPKRA